MPLTKQYLTYQSQCSFGLVTGRKSNALLWRQSDKLLIISPCLESIVVWDPRTSLKVRSLYCDSEVSVIALNTDSSRLVAGCENGSIHVFDLSQSRPALTLSGHKSSVSCLAFSEDGTRVVSGSKDTNIIVWDLIAESGLYRLKGHKGQVTTCRIVPGYNVLITSSKDGLVKVWDLDTQHCFQTLAQHRSEVWSMEIIQTTLVTASNKFFLFQISPPNEGDKVALVVREMGHVQTVSQERLTSVKVDSTGRYLACLHADSSMELFLMLTQEEIEKKERKRAKKAAKKGEQVKKKLDIMKSLCQMSQSKARSVDLLCYRGDLWVLLVLQDNSVSLYTVKDSLPHLTHSIIAPGHRTDVRTICFSSDDSKILTGSAEAIKVWNAVSLQCVCTLTSGYALCSTFVPGNRHAVVGTKAGSLQVFDLNSAHLTSDDTSAHSGPIWSIALTPDKRGVVTGSADQSVKFWDFELTNQQLSLSHVRTLKMSEDVMCVRFSPDSRLLAVALIDSTVKLFFTDTIKFFLSLYGHKLPVLSMDISSDSTLLASCSADKNIRIWGLDFGDCHKSLFAHDSSITAVQFLPNTHQLVSTGKDKLIKRWDADTFEHIQTLEGHCGEVWCVAVNSNGALMVSGSHDHSLYVWERTREPLVLSEQREMEREKILDDLAGQDSLERVVPGEKEGEASLPTTRSKDTLTAADRLMEAISLWLEDREKLADHDKECALTGTQIPPPKPHPILVAMGNIKAERYVLNVLKGVRSSELEESLLVLPFHQATLLLELTDIWLQANLDVELSCRCLLFLLRVHHNQLIGTRTLQPLLSRLQDHTHSTVAQYKDMFGVNLAGLHYLKEQLVRKGQDVFGEVPGLLRKQHKHTS